MRFRSSAHWIWTNYLAAVWLWLTSSVLLLTELLLLFASVLPSRLVLQAIVARHRVPIQFADPLAFLDRQHPIRQHAEGI